MCTTCGCGDTELVSVELREKILAGNDRAAAHNREHFRESKVLALNIMGSPGSGKTAVLEATAGAMKGSRLGAVSADLATDNDARRLQKAGILSKAITTGQSCHLDAELVHRSLHDFPWRELDYFFIENVGNLVCPAIYDLGQEANVVALSVTEGEDKPLKYPVMFQKADLVLVTKCDLVPHLEVDVKRLEENIARVMPKPQILRVSARTLEGIEGWRAWLESMKKALPVSQSHEHGHDHEHAHEHAHGSLVHSHSHDHGHEPDGHGHTHGHEHAHEHAHGSLVHSHSHDHADSHTHDQGQRLKR